MKRDDFGVRIDEIRELATKYSKPDLARMVQMGMLDPQKALMAGMMIDRIAQSAMKPPETTVAQDVLGQQPTSAQGQIPPGIMAAPNAPPPSAGVAALPSGIREMAGGGIVAFDEGGEVPGYADRGYVDVRNDPAMRVNPSVQAQRDKDRYFILAQELRDAQRRMERGDPRAEGDVKSLQREMRRIKPAPSADAGITSLFPSAEAAQVTPAAPAPAPAAAPEYMYQDPFGAPSVTEGDISLKQKVEPGKPYDPSLRGLMFGYERAQPEPATPAVPKPAAPATKFEVSPVVPEKKEAPPAVTETKLEKPDKIVAQQLTVPTQLSMKDAAEEIKGAYQEFGVDTDMYRKQMEELKGKKASLAQRREQALGAALMSFGLELSGARQGQEFQSLSRAGVNALGQYTNNMDKIVENEERIDMLNRQLQMAENNFKRTGAESALTQVRARRERIDQIEAKNAELKQRADEAQAKIAADIFGAELGAEVRREVGAANAAAKAAVAARAGKLSEKQRFDIKQQLRTELEPKLREQYKNHPNRDKKVAEELQKQINAEITALEAQSSGYGGNPPQDLFQDWSVEGM